MDPTVRRRPVLEPRRPRDLVHGGAARRNGCPLGRGSLGQAASSRARARPPRARRRLARRAGPRQPPHDQLHRAGRIGERSGTTRDLLARRLRLERSVGRRTNASLDRARRGQRFGSRDLPSVRGRIAGGQARRRRWDSRSRPTASGCSRITRRATARPARLSLLPTGAGEARTLGGDGFVDYSGSDWLPDGKGIVFGAKKADGVWRLYVQALPDGNPRAIGPEGARLPPFSNRGFAGRKVRRRRPLGPGAAGSARRRAGTRPRRHLAPGRADHPMERRLAGPVRLQHGGSSGKALAPRRGFRPEATLEGVPGRREHGLLPVRVAPDGGTWAIAGRQVLSELYLVEGLR